MAKLVLVLYCLIKAGSGRGLKIAYYPETLLVTRRVQIEGVPYDSEQV